MKEKKLSLLNEFEKMNPFISKDKKEERIKDERIINENNKIISTTYCVLVIILVLGSIILATLNIEIKPRFVVIAVSIVSYIGLILLCKKNAIEGNEYAFTCFIWSIFTLPVTIFNSFSNLIYQNIENVIIIILVVLVAIIGFPVLLYQIANIIYKKNNQ